MGNLNHILEKSGIDLASAKALEVFGGDGTFHLMEYANDVQSLDVWECNPDSILKLNNVLPQANIYLCDVYERVKVEEKRFDLIVVDNPAQTQYGHCEHFDLFPDIFRLMADTCLLVLNIIPIISNKCGFPELNSAHHQEQRKRFYVGADPNNLTEKDLTYIYNKLAFDNGFILTFSIIIPRGVVYYLAIRLEKRAKWQQ